MTYTSLISSSRAESIADIRFPSEALTSLCRIALCSSLEADPVSIHASTDIPEFDGQNQQIKVQISTHFQLHVDEGFGR